MLEPRIYRAALIPALVAVVVTMFSLESRPPPVPQELAADVLFEGRLASGALRQLVSRHPDRRPGRPGDAASAAIVRDALAERGFETRVDSFEADGLRLSNVLARRTGSSRRQIVVMAGRDPADGRAVPDATGSAADTAALLEIARVLEGRASRKTLVLASVDGTSLGAGASRFVETIEDRDQIDAVLLLSNLGARTARGPLLVGWSNDPRRGSLGLGATAMTSLGQEMGTLPKEEGAVGQLVRLALPLGIGPQGSLLAEGIEAIRFSGSGELPPPTSQTSAGEIDPERMGDLGRAVLRTLAALDAGPTPEHGPKAYVQVARQVIPGWALSLLGLTLILPPLVTAADAASRAHRRREALGAWTAWVLAGAAPFAAGLIVAHLSVLAGLAPDAPEAPAAPESFPFGAGPAAVLAACLGSIAAAWVVGRPRLARPLSRLAGWRDGASTDAASPGAAVATALVLSVAALAVWAANPFAGLLMAPLVNLWLLALLAGSGDRAAPGALLLGAGAVVPAAALALYLFRLSLDPLEGAWYLLLLVTGGHVDLISVLLACVVLGVLGSAISVLLARARRPAPAAPSRPRIRGPGTYIGPGSLGGTTSARR